MTADQYGSCLFCVKVAESLSPDGEICAYADRVALRGGALLLQRIGDDGEEQTTLAVAAGLWRAFFAASCIDGAAVAVESWTGEVSR